MKKGMFVLILIAFFAASGVSQGAEDEKESRTEIAPQPEKKGVVEEKRRKKVPTMKQVLVSATKTDEERKDIANSVIYKDEMDIQESPAKTLGEFLANELGVDWRTRGNYGGAAEEIHIRGMSGNATQVFVNGVSVNSPSLGSADVGRIPMNNIERIEVIKGSASVLDGSGAMGGAIHVFTKRPQKDKIDLKVMAGYGSDDTYQVSAEQGMFIWDGLGYYLTANYLSSGGPRHNSGLDHRDFSARLVYEMGDLLDVSLYGDYINRNYGRPGVEPPKFTEDFWVEGTQVYGKRDASRLDKGADKDMHLVLDIKSEPFSWLGLRAKGELTSMENYNYARWVAGSPAWGIPYSLPGNEAWTTNEILGIEGNVTFTPIEEAKLLLGAEHKDYDWKNKSINLDGDGGRLDGTKTVIKADFHTTGIFAEAQYRPCKYFKGQAGIRRETHRQFGSETLPRFGIIFNPFENTAIKVSHGRHYRAPTPNDLYWPEDPFAMGNPDLDPEKGWHTDVTVEQSLFDDKVFLTASYFHWDLDSKILWGPDSQGVWMPDNLKRYKANGVEVGAKIGPFYNLTLNLNYTYQRAKERAKVFSKQLYASPGFPPWVPPNDADFHYHWVDRRATYTPKSLFKGALSYESPWGTTAMAVFRYVGNRVFYNTETDKAYPRTKTVRYGLDSYWTADLKIEQRLFDHWILSLEANNLFGKRYTTYIQGFTDQNTGNTNMEGYPGAGRSAFFSVTYEH